ncbi:hydrolase 1, exosortase A system-associated [Ectothiorhodospira variabilis]|uniref:hydrolase 1, exosortase A system-associated n=1 Tax=Ectothiorhodospira variabilis TaxID=505694 RepID=UPI001EFAD7EE|nr:hydrolase 1, exosortase A system-associated [Ectothiorhodospira variabilis]MCG5494759.1 hydrolase 1, exosortase A system-associated [Ectothiorhodospira variabilis]MCG5504352.1 hydrolase 1, exosortase A system-associated [Ectothiorhodospira variabilis]MCG5507507.1 hydrolase 1, exosortase A system-associated [Ectothiorhodospira variabilis]
MTSEAFVFHVDDEPLAGIMHPGKPGARRGVLIVVGGPQYRVGSHRQFLLLARHLAQGGIPVMRFDYRGMGDSDGAQRSFEHISQDLRAAVDAFQERTPGVQEVVVWGLCDAASAALLNAWRDPRITGLVLLNPWVRTEAGLARAYLKQYYLKRLMSRDFWAGLLGGRVNPLKSARSLVGMARRALRRQSGQPKGAPGDAPQVLPEMDPGQPLPDRMAEGWRRFSGPILLILSGDDLTAAEFRGCAEQSTVWRGLLDEDRVTVRELRDANHTFSREAWRQEVAHWTCEWMESSLLRNF